MTAPQKVLQPWDDAHFKQFGLKRNVIEPWEDGLRTQLDKAGYEWWYFDTHMDDGTQIVVVFYTKSMIAAKGPLTPFATIEITYPDGRKTEERVDATPSQCRFSTDGCDVKIGPCTVTGDLTNYHIHFQSKNVTAELDLHGTVPSWRPGVGGTLYGDDEAKQFFWLPSVPSGAVRAVVSDHGTTKTYNGSGYHDHNWGNVSIANLVHHWYWGRAQIGPYMIISAWLTAEKQFGFAETPVFMLTKNGKLITGNEDGGLRFTATDKSTDPNTGKPFSATLVYEWESPEGTLYRITFQRERDIAYLKMVDQLPKLMRLGAKLTGKDPSYIRFAGTASIDVIEDGATVEHCESPAIWELMHLGKVYPGSSLDRCPGTGGDPEGNCHLSRRRLSPRTRCHAISESKPADERGRYALTIQRQTSLPHRSDGHYLPYPGRRVPREDEDRPHARHGRPLPRRHRHRPGRLGRESGDRGDRRAGERPVHR